MLNVETGILLLCRCVEMTTPTTGAHFGESDLCYCNCLIIRLVLLWLIKIKLDLIYNQDKIRKHSNS